MVTLPQATTTLANIATYSSPFFNEYIQYIWLALGILTAVLAVLWLKRVIVSGVSGLFQKKVDTTYYPNMKKDFARKDKGWDED